MADGNMNLISTESPQMSSVDAMPQRALVAISPALDTSIEIVVCIPCFRRPHHLRQTLESLSQ